VKMHSLGPKKRFILFMIISNSYWIIAMLWCWFTTNNMFFVLQIAEYFDSVTYIFGYGVLIGVTFNFISTYFFLTGCLSESTDCAKGDRNHFST